MHLVPFPFTAVSAGWEAPDIDRSCVVGKGELADIAQQLRRAVEQHGQGHHPLTDVDGDAGERPAYVGLFHQLPVEWGAQPGVDDSADFEERLPRELGELAAQRPQADLFDSVVVDEAQDFGALWWPSLVACLRDAAGGGLYVFMDETQRVFAREGDAPIDLPPYVLDENATPRPSSGIRRGCWRTTDAGRSAVRQARLGTGAWAPSRRR